ncbi:MAG: tRNA lysidine(34) synthetase TilS [Nitrospirota bacterium]
MPPSPMPQDQAIHSQVLRTIDKYSMLHGTERVLVGLSGGADSVCLLHILNHLKVRLKLELHALYVDHGLRPEETPAEIAFCRKFCEGLSVPFMKKAVDVKSFAEEQGLNKQEAARELRYRRLEEAASEINADKIALAHTADDQLETVIMRFLRGSGSAGLAGIPPVRKNIIRPLIGTERREIERFIRENNLEYTVDSSNLKEDYARNKVRLSVIPMLKELNPHVIETLSRTAEIFRDEERYFEIIVTKALMKMICRKTARSIEIFLAPFEIMDKVIMRRVLRRAVDETKGLRGIGFIHIEDIIELIKRGDPGDRLYLPKGIRAIKEYATLHLTSEPPQKIETVGLPVPGQVTLREARAVIKASLSAEESDFGDGKMTIVLDADKTGTSLAIRARDQGDFFYPLGFGRRKKLQDYFVDQKVPRDERDIVPVVTSGEGVIWIAGFRGDDRFKVTDATKQFLKLELKKAL